MNPEVKDRWIKALKSGEYTKGLHALNRDGKYCCLGVLSEVQNVPSKLVGSGYHNYMFEDGYNSCSYPSRKFLLEIGLSTYHADHLAALNDTTTNFDEVVKFIEDEVV